MKKILSLAVITALSFSASITLQAEETADVKGPWAGSAGIGYFASSGNSEGQNVNADLALTYQVAGSRWTHKINALALNADSNSVRSAERYAAGYQADFALNQRSYFFGRIDADKDRFSAYDLRKTEALGYGYKIIDTDIQKWNVELGIGATQLDLLDGSSQSSGVGIIGTDYLRKLSETAEFEQNFDYELSSDNNYLNSVTSLRAKVWGNLGIKLSYNIKNNSDVPVGVEKTDKYTSIGIDYSF